ncbi:MAG: zinc-dependent metalloprotease [Microthrixaceae bacterium]
MPSAIDWRTAQVVATTIARRAPHDRDAEAGLVADFEDLTAQAQTLVEAHTGWRSEAGAARARVVDREAWVRANIASFKRMLRPMTDRLEEHLGRGPTAFASAKVAGAELGVLLGWMSTRVLGQYDLLVLEDEDPDDQDIVYYVGPNIAALENRHSFPNREFRLWVALHEVTHRTQFTGKPWLRHYFLEQVSSLMTMADPDPARLFDALGRVAEAIRQRRNPLDDGGVVALFADRRQRETMDRVGGLMSLLEGHGDVTMDRAGGDRIPPPSDSARCCATAATTDRCRHGSCRSSSGSRRSSTSTSRVSASSRRSRRWGSEAAGPRLRRPFHVADPRGDPPSERVDRQDRRAGVRGRDRRGPTRVGGRSLTAVVRSLPRPGTPGPGRSSDM